MAKLDFFRAVAVLMVFFGHLTHTFGYDQFGPVAHLGVLLFFIHTSLVLCMSFHRTGGEVVPFYLRRLFRIYPLSILTVVAVVAFRIPVSPWDKPYTFPGWSTVLANLGLYHNLIGPRQSVLAVLWSLPLEVQMYALLPLVFVFASTRRRTYILWISSIVLAFLTRSFDLHANFFLWAPCFLCGMIAYHETAKISFKTLAWILAALCIPIGHGPLWLNHPFVSIIAGVAIGRASEPTNQILRRVSAAIAKFSYGIYLTHLPLMWLCFKNGHTLLNVVTFVVLAVTVPVVAYYVVEEPLIKLGRRVAASASLQTGRAPSSMKTARITITSAEAPVG